MTITLIQKQSHQKKAFSILELMIVLGVMAFLMGLGITGLISFRNNLDFDAIYTDIQLAIKTAQNNARNSRDVEESVNSTDPVSAEYYVLQFDINSVTTGKKKNKVTTTTYDYSQAYLQNLNKGSDIISLPYERVSNLTNDYIEFSFVENDRALTIDDCQNIAFKRLTAELVFLKPGNKGTKEINEGSCTLTITHKDLPGVQRQIVFNAQNNQITYD